YVSGRLFVSVAADVVVVAGAAFHAVVARTAGQRVVTFARHDVVAVDGAVPDHVLGAEVADLGAVGQQHELAARRQRRLVHVRRRRIVDDVRRRGEAGDGPDGQHQAGARENG